MSALLAALAAVHLHHAPPPNPCRSRACVRRVTAKQHRAVPLRPAFASWYGPGLYGNPLGCGGTLYQWTRGVAHKSIACGTRVRVCAARCRTTRVIDRGPYVGSREFDLTQALAGAVGFRGVGVIRVRIGG